MKALVTGATGFIGSHLAQKLVERGLEVRALTRSTSNTKWIDHIDLETVEASMSDIDSLKAAVEGVDYVYHIAGAVASSTREGFFRGNVDPTRNLLTAIEEVNPGLRRFLFSSSLAAVGPAMDLDHPKTEKDKRTPITTYGESKAAAEEVVEEFMGRLPISVVRPPAVYGPRDVGIYTFFQVVARGIAPLIGFDEKVVTLVHVYDLVDGMIRAAESETSIGETFFIGSTVDYTWPEVGDVAAKVMGKGKTRYLRIPHSLVFTVAGINGFLGRFQKKPPILDLEKGKDITQRYWICSSQKAVEELGYRQQMSIEAGVRNTVEWYREQGWLK